MERELWNKVYQIVMRNAKNKRPRCATFSDAQVMLTYLWAVLNNRPVYWACCKRNWPLHMRKKPLPTPSTMTRRLRSSSLQVLMNNIEQQLINANIRSTCRWIDAKPLAIGGCSKDKESSFGFGASCMLRGYKLYAVADQNQGFVAWKVKAIRHSEASIAAELIRQLDTGGYLIGDTAYDAGTLHDLAAECGIQLVAPRRCGKGLGHRRQSKYRLRSLELQQREFGQGLVASRRTIERMFGNLTTFNGGLGPLPFWVRTLFRVENWVRAKMIFFHLWRELQNAKLSA